ncbi:MAG: YHYH protein [Bacteroidota bacterium]
MNRLKLIVGTLVVTTFLWNCSNDNGSVDVDDDTSTNSDAVSDMIAQVSSSAAMVSWLQADSETSWTVEYGESGFTPGDGTSGTDASSLGRLGASRISGLSPSTTYDIYVTVDGSSESARTSFTTLDDGASVFSISNFEDDCTNDVEGSLDTMSSYSESIEGTTRTITINSVPNHLVGTFPTDLDRRIGNPNTISVQDDTYTVTTEPSLAGTTTSGQGMVNGILFSGVAIEVYTAERFTGFTGEVNQMWTRTTLQSVDDLGLDWNNAHVQPTGQYHYHGIPNAYGEELGVENSDAMIKIGYAADGFPIYYLYYDDGTGNLMEAEASYEFRTGDRGGDGITGPSGSYDGEYFEDYEYVEGSGDLDACNGRTGPTPEAPDGEYYYVVTKDFPSFPLCFSGTPDASFQNGPGGGGPPPQ